MTEQVKTSIVAHGREWGPARTRGRLSSALEARWALNTTELERALTFPCDCYVPEPHDVYFRAVNVDAPKQVMWRWLCQLRVAPYSYDWIDNLGRQSPRELTPGVERLELGQRMMTTTEIVEFEPEKQLTLRIARWRWFFGLFACTYLLLPRGENSCCVVVKLTAYAPSGLVALLQKLVLPWCSLVMTRKQLLNLKALAERQAHV